METVDITPTWYELMPYFFHILEESNEEAKKPIRTELLRLAKFADDVNNED